MGFTTLFCQLWICSKFSTINCLKIIKDRWRYDQAFFCSYFPTFELFFPFSFKLDLCQPSPLCCQQAHWVISYLTNGGLKDKRQTLRTGSGIPNARLLAPQCLIQKNCWELLVELAHPGIWRLLPFTPLPYASHLCLQFCDCVLSFSAEIDQTQCYHRNY